MLVAQSKQSNKKAVKLLRRRELEAAYRRARREFDKAWETTASDGLVDEKHAIKEHRGIG